MPNDFDTFFDGSVLPKVIKMDRTLSKKECEHVYDYFKVYRPKLMFEFGVQFGCSSRIFLEISKNLNTQTVLHSWDIRDAIKKQVINREDFSLHIEDVTGREKSVFDKYNPDMVYLDAHPYLLTKNIMEICIERRINFMTHDVVSSIGYERTKKRTNNFTDFSIQTNANWELYLLCKLFNDTLWKNDNYEDEKVSVKCIRDSCGLAIIKFKK